MADPDGDLDVPKKQQVFTASAVAFSGTVTDDIGVDWAKLAIKNTATGMYLKDNGTIWVIGSLLHVGAMFVTYGPVSSGSVRYLPGFRMITFYSDR